MANGTTRPISEVAVGDEVLATNTETGETQPRTVTDTMVMFHDGDLLDLTIEDDDGQGVIQTTDNHGFWSITDQRWERAIDLAEGEEVRQADGSVATVTRVEERDGTEDMWDLTVAVDHNFYVATGDDADDPSALVHNKHACTWQLRNPDGTFRSSGFIESGSRTAPGRRLTWAEHLTTHTEFKLMEDLQGIAKRGDIITLQGTLDPCKAGGGCQSAMKAFAESNGVKIIYSAGGKTWTWGG